MTKTYSSARMPTTVTKSTARNITSNIKPSTSQKNSRFAEKYLHLQNVNTTHSRLKG